MEMQATVKEGERRVARTVLVCLRWGHVTRGPKKAAGARGHHLLQKWAVCEPSKGGQEPAYPGAEEPGFLSGDPVWTTGKVLLGNIGVWLDGTHL